MAAVGVVSGVGGPVLNALLLHPSHPTRHRHHHVPLAGLIVGAVIILLCIGLTIWLVRKMWRGTGHFAAPLTIGLPRRQRREVNRAIRRGRPSNDPALAAVERETAERLVRQFKAGALLFGGFIVLEAVEAVTASRPSAKAFFAAATLLFAALFVLQLWLVLGARRYLAA
jgi:hypothetical protein